MLCVWFVCIQGCKQGVKERAAVPEKSWQYHGARLWFKALVYVENEGSLSN